MYCSVQLYTAREHKFHWSENKIKKIAYGNKSPAAAWIFTVSHKRAWESHHIFFLAQKPPPPNWARASSFTKFLDHTQRRTTVGGRTSLFEWSARRRDLYLTTHNTHKRQISMSPVRFEPTISAGERSQTYTLDRTSTGIGPSHSLRYINYDYYLHTLFLKKYRSVVHTGRVFVCALTIFKSIDWS